MKRKIAFILLLIFTLNFVVPATRAVAADGETVGLWVAGGFTSLIYTPLKAAFFLLFGILGGLTMVITVPIDEMETSAKFIRWGFYGDWLIRPDHFRGQSSVKFVGTERKIRFVWVDPKFDHSRFKGLSAF